MPEHVPPDVTAATPRGNCQPAPGASDAQRKASADRMFATDRAGVAAAKRVCVGCPVQSACYERAVLRREEHGVWGGVSFPAEVRVLSRVRVRVSGMAVYEEVRAS